MFSISMDKQLARSEKASFDGLPLDARESFARAERVRSKERGLDKRLKADAVCKRAEKEKLLSLKLDYREVKYDMDCFRNALIMVCDGDAEMINDALAAAVSFRKQNKGWEY